MVHSKDTSHPALRDGHGHYIWQTYERQNRPTPMAVAIVITGVLRWLPFLTSLETDEFSVAGGIMGDR